jgi:hypothetical protein
MRSTWPAPCNLGEFRLISQQNTSSRCVHAANDPEALDWTPLHRETPDPEALDFNEALSVSQCTFPDERAVRAPHYGVIPPCEVTILQHNTPLVHATIDHVIMCVCLTQQ